MINKKINKSLFEGRHGFTLIEVLVALFIFTLIVTASSTSFIRFITSYKDARAIQRDLEDAQHVMNLMAKTIRTSSIVDYSASMLRIFDYSQVSCIEYVFDGSNLSFSTASDGGSAITEATCISDTLVSQGNLISGKVSNLIFDVAPSSDVSGFEEIGKATISIEVSRENDSAQIQTTVSLRDYDIFGI